MMDQEVFIIEELVEDRMLAKYSIRNLLKHI